jgi:hypothetical protein
MDFQIFGELDLKSLMVHFNAKCTNGGRREFLNAVIIAAMTHEDSRDGLI